MILSPLCDLWNKTKSLVLNRHHGYQYPVLEFFVRVLVGHANPVTTITCIHPYVSSHKEPSIRYGVLHTEKISDGSIVQYEDSGSSQILVILYSMRLCTERYGTTLIKFSPTLISLPLSYRSTLPNKRSSENLFHPSKSELSATLGLFKSLKS